MSRWKFAFEYNFTQLTVKFPGMKLIILLFSMAIGFSGCEMDIPLASKETNTVLPPATHEWAKDFRMCCQRCELGCPNYNCKHIGIMI